MNISSSLPLNDDASPRAVQPGAALLNLSQHLSYRSAFSCCDGGLSERLCLSIRNTGPNVFTLIGWGAGSAFAHSLIATFAPGVFAGGLRQAHGSATCDIAIAAIVTEQILLGQVMKGVALRHEPPLIVSGRP